MKYNQKFNAFTLAEVMILLLTLSILMAAFAPVFTRRYNNASSDDVWAFVSSDDDEDAYFDTINKSYTSQAFIGLTPTGDADVKKMSSDGNGNILYSKLVIAAGGSVKPGNKKQNQILFRYGTAANDKDGDPVGALFADGSNFLLGGLYDNTVSGTSNTAYGSGALEKLTSGKYNTAVGKNALGKLMTGEYNTGVGVNAGSSFTAARCNTAVGVNSMLKIVGYDNTAIGKEAMGSDSSSTRSAYQNTAVGTKSLYNITSGHDNTAVGYEALENLTTGSYNTAIGYRAMSNLTTGSYNTAIGAFSCGSSNLTSNNYKTCIGYNSGNTGMSQLYNTNDERVFIGSAPAQYVNSSGSDKPAAVLEVHNINSGRIDSLPTYQNTSNKVSTKPIPFIGDSSVVINGNLIVRGNPYFETPLRRPSNAKAAAVAYNSKGTVNDDGSFSPGSGAGVDYFADAHIPKGLVLYHLLDYNGKFVLKGFEGYNRNTYSWETCRGGCGRGSHQFKDVRTNCICTGVNARTFEGTTNSGLNGYRGDSDEPYMENGINIGYARTNFDTTYDHYETNAIINVSDSYDWASKTYARSWDNTNTRSPYNGTPKIFPSYFDNNSVSCNNFYDDNHTPKIPPLDRNNITTQEPQYNTWPYINNGAFYTDRSYNKFIYLERRPTRCNGGYDNDVDCSGYQYGLRGTDLPLAHMRLEHGVGGLNVSRSCCPMLTNDLSQSGPYRDYNTHPALWDFQLSDRRLKDVGARFTAGLNEIRKLNVYNYTFKADKNNVPQVGVIAQDLRLVFPNAVSKDQNGFYQIRWDEMFYAAINSIKTLYTKAQALVVRVSNDKQRISNLKADNKELNAKLDNLAKELDKLEADEH